MVCDSDAGVKERRSVSTSCSPSHSIAFSIYKVDLYKVPVNVRMILKIRARSSKREVTLLLLVFVTISRCKSINTS